MLTDAAIKALRPQRKIYKVSDRDGMYVRVMPSGAISFRLDLSPERAARDRLPREVRARRDLTRPRSRTLHRCKASHQRRAVACD